MQAERVLLETDEHGRLLGIPQLPPSAQIEAIFLVVSTSRGRRHRSPQLKASLQIHGDVVAPAFEDKDWDLLR